MKKSILNTIKKPSKLFIGMVGIPFSLAVAYYALIAEPRYVTETRVAVKSLSATPDSPLASLLSTVSSSRQDELYLIDRAQSLDVAQKLDEKEHIRKAWHWTAGRDVLNRFWLNTSEDFLNQYRKNVTANLDPLTSDLVIRVQSFDAPQSERLAKLLLQDLDSFTNDMSQKLAKEQVKFAEDELTSRHKAYVEATAALTAFQSKNRMLDAESEGKQKMETIASLEAELAKAEAELAGGQAYLNQGSFQLQGMKQKVAALQSQITRERNRLTQGDSKYTEKMTEFHQLKVAVEIAEHRYKQALTVLEQVRIESVRKAKTFAVIAEPHLAEKAIYPRYAYELATALGALLALFGLTRLTMSLMREHRN